MNTAELIVKLRQAAHALELGIFGTPGEDPFPELVELLDAAADALKTAWVEGQTITAVKQMLLAEPTDEQKVAMLKTFDKEAKI